jgi:hypothetical protein
VAQTEVTVTVGEAHDVASVVESLRRAGLEVAQVLPELGIVIGAVEAGALGAVSSVEGVESVDAPASVQLPPPDSEIQ